jgi:hypothetical protein
MDMKKPGESQRRVRKKSVTSYPLVVGVSADSASSRETGGKGGRISIMRFGSVAAKTHSPHPDIKGANITAGQDALKRSKKAFIKRGVALRHRKGVPIFFADPKEPSVLIRRLNGQEERGRIVGGAFVPAE